MLNTKPFLCFDFGAGTVKVGEFAANESGTLTLTQFGVKALGQDGMQESKREAAVLKAIQDLFSQKPYRGKNINVCAPGFHVFSKFVKLPPVDASKVTQIIQYEAQQNVPFPLQEVVWDYQIMGTSAGGELEVLLVAIKSEVVEGLFRTAEAAGLRLQLVDVSPAALCNAFRFNYGDQEGCTMLLDIGAKTSNLLFFEKGKVYARGINIGANSITTDFIAEAKMPFAKAEELKISEGFVSLGGAYEEPENPHQAAISKIARQVMTRLHMQVNQTIQFYRTQQGGSAPQRLFLAGGGSIMAYTREFFAEKLNVPIEYFNPFRNVQIAQNVAIEELEKVAHSFGEVVGLGLRNLAQCPVELNLVPKSIRSRQQFEQKKPYFIAAIFSLVLVVFAYGIFYGKIAGVKQSSLDTLNQQLTPFENKVQQLEAQQNQIKNTTNQIARLAGYLQDKFYWPDTLTEVRAVLAKAETEQTQPGRPVGVWIEKFGNPTGGASDTSSSEDENNNGGGMYGGLAFYMRNPELMKRYFPQLYKQMGPGDKSGSEEGGDATKKAVAAPVANTNTVSIDIKLRAMNLDKNGTGSNVKLAYAVEEAFKNDPMFDSGTKLDPKIETVEASADTFTFGLTLKLKNPMRTM
ncbi:MAG TPA: type IV pilus assembly protein PilM [Verrucomicrobiae bacterium]|nr:type IV pilus assembly protein PilM [Verrucomicrobiae bacterium]